MLMRMAMRETSIAKSPLISPMFSTRPAPPAASVPLVAPASSARSATTEPASPVGLAPPVKPASSAASALLTGGLAFSVGSASFIRSAPIELGTLGICIPHRVNVFRQAGITHWACKNGPATTAALKFSTGITFFKLINLATSAPSTAPVFPAEPELESVLILLRLGQAIN